MPVGRIQLLPTTGLSIIGRDCQRPLGGAVGPQPSRRAAVRPAITRARFLRGALFAGGGVLIGGVPLLSRAPKIVHARTGQSTDDKILNFALLIEYLEEGFYLDALSKNALSGELLLFAQEVSAHEAAHVQLLREALGNNARPRPTFDFGDDTNHPRRFASAAVVLEETGSGAYIGQGANMSRGVAVIAARIASVEARHCAWIRDILGRHPAPHAADPAMTEEEVSAAIRETGFLS